MNDAVIYCRVSSKEQVQNLSLPTQRKGCLEYCQRQGWNAVKIFVEEGESAKTAERPEFQKMLTYCRENKGRVQYVVVYNLSRFSRNTYDHSAIRLLLSGLKITLRSVTEPLDDSPSGKLMENVLASFAQFDNDVRAERTKAGMKAALEKGRWPFKAPLGYKNIAINSIKNIEPDPEKSPLIREAFELMATGCHSKHEVLEIVSQKGLKTAKGKKISRQSFDALLRKTVYAVT
jgi:DNA invertase Pin-like site-specific DNA recombinase